MVERSTTPTGNALLWAAVALLLTASGWHRFLPLVPLMILAQRFPARRMLIMSLGGTGWVLHRRLTDLGVKRSSELAAASLVVLVLLYLFFRLARSFAQLPRVVRRSPQIALHLLLWCVIALTMRIPGRFGVDPAWAPAPPVAVVLLVAFSIWRIGFMVQSGKRGSIKETGFASHLFYCVPSFGGSHTPYGKGYDYLVAKQAESRDAIARSQLAGLKLLLLAWLWTAVLPVFEHPDRVGGDYAPRLQWIASWVGAAPVPLELGIAWAGLLADMIRSTLDLAIRGHLIVGCLRLFGFNVFRNTYKPLLATSIVAFWNRYYYYFKELLVEFFFFPTYVTFFKGRPGPRVFAATMAAAFVGNFYYHVLQRLDELGRADLAASLPELGSYLFYAFLLGIGVFVSMLREQQRRGRAVAPRSAAIARLVTLRKIAGVWLFFALIRIWDTPHRTFWQNTSRFLGLFGVHSGPGAPHG